MKKRMATLVGITAGLVFSSWGTADGETSSIRAPSTEGVSVLEGLDGGDSQWQRLHEKETKIIAEASRLLVPDQLAMYLGERPSPRGADSHQASLRNRVRRLLTDPAIASNFASIQNEWFIGSLTEWSSEPPLFSNTREFIECKVMISRNLFFRELTPSARNVRDGFERIQNLRRRYGEVEVFSGRNVVFAASDDQTRTGDYVFGRPPTVRWLGLRAASMEFMREDEAGEEPADTKARLVDHLSIMENLTFVFEGHGRPRKMNFGGGLSPEDLAAGLTARPSRETSLYVSAPWSVVVLNTCQAHTFARELLDLIRSSRPERQLPVVIVPVEFGDDLIKSVYNDNFIKGELKLSYRSDTHLAALYSRLKVSTSVYVPDEENVLTQIA